MENPEVLFGVLGIVVTVLLGVAGWLAVIWSWVASVFTGGLAMAGGGITAVLLALFSLSVDGCQQAPNGDAFSKTESGYQKASLEIAEEGEKVPEFTLTAPVETTYVVVPRR